MNDLESLIVSLKTAGKNENDLSTNQKEIIAGHILNNKLSIENISFDHFKIWESIAKYMISQEEKDAQDAVALIKKSIVEFYIDDINNIFKG